MAVGYATVSLDQASDTPVQHGQGEGFGWYCAYSRAAETRAAGATGQDCLVLRHDRSALAFALCDGVGQSFFGDLAARVLAHGLVAWLWDAAPLAGGPEGLASALAAFLADLTLTATAEVQAQALPPDLSSWVQEVLERKRHHGSESTFVCGRIDLPTGALPTGRVFLAWLGDSRLRLWGPGGERTAELGDTFHTAQRWSTLRGAIGGAPHTFVIPLVSDGGQAAVSALLAYSDGLAALDGLPVIPPGDTVATLIGQAGEMPASDDISLLALTEIMVRPPTAVEPVHQRDHRSASALPGETATLPAAAGNGAGQPTLASAAPKSIPLPVGVTTAADAQRVSTAGPASDGNGRRASGTAPVAGVTPVATAEAAPWQQVKDWLPFLAFCTVLVLAVLFLLLPGRPLSSIFLRGSGSGAPATATPTSAGSPAASPLATPTPTPAQPSPTAKPTGSAAGLWPALLARIRNGKILWHFDL